MSPSPTLIAMLGFALALLIAERIAELLLAARHLERLIARGAVEFGRRHFVGFLVLHIAYPVALAAEVLAGGARPPSSWPWLLLVLIGAQALRLASIVALGERWHVRVWVLPGLPPVRRGIYRFLDHPNYIAVALELCVLPLLFGAWRTAIAASALNALMMAIRIPAEKRALRWAAEGPSRTATAPRT